MPENVKACRPHGCDPGYQPVTEGTTIADVLEGRADWVVVTGDNADVRGRLPREGLAVVSDVPYGQRYVGSPGYSNPKGIGTTYCPRPGKAIRTRETVVGDDADFDPLPWTQWPCCISGAQHYYHLLPKGGSLHSWDKRGDYERTTFADADFIWCSRKTNAQTFRLVWRGLCRHAEYDQRIEHPTQKPVALMEWMIDLLQPTPGSAIFDPYCGSGTTGVAAVRKGFRFIGCELVASYADIARRRIREAEPVLFTQPKRSRSRRRCSRDPRRGHIRRQASVHHSRGDHRGMRDNRYGREFRRRPAEQPREHPADA